MTPVPVPDRFQGAWRRVSIAVDRGPPTEPASVVWVQASSAYADLRLPDDPGATTMSFAGTTRWDDPFLRWEHALDLEATSGEDVGEVSWDGTDLVESGSFVSDGRPVGYIEVWRRQPGSGGPRQTLVLDDGTGILVRAGAHALTVVDDRSQGGRYRACYRTLGPEGWTVAMALCGESEDLPAPPSETAATPGGTVVLNGWTWRLADVGG